MKHIFSRRNVLRGTAGLLSLPLMESLQVRAAESTYPKRLVVFYNPNGTVADDWFPRAGESETDFELGSIHQPLAPYKDLLTILRGIDNTVGQDLANPGGPHQRGIGALFTGEMLLEGEFTDGCGQKAGFAAGISIDQVIAAKIGTTTPIRSLELGVRATSNDVQGRIAYAGPGQPLPPTNSPTEVYQRIFSRAQPLQGGTSDERRMRILETVRGQFGALNSKLSLQDRNKLGEHLALVEDLERRIEQASLHDSEQCQPPTDLAVPEWSADSVDSELTMPEISRSQLDLLAMAFSCDLTRVASVQYSTGFNRIRYPWLDSEGEGHSLSHAGESNQVAWDAISKRAQWHAAEIAYFLGRLAAIPEGDGSVLDNTLVVWGNEVSRGNNHSLDDIPFLLAGTAGGAIASGRYLEYDGESHCNLLHTIASAFEIELESFGHTAHSTGQLSGLLT